MIQKEFTKILEVEARMDPRPKTIFCDIDGTLVKHRMPGFIASSDPEIIDGTLEKLHEWDKKGYNIILVTGRKESLREITERELSSLGIFYDRLIMGIGGGHRVLINDRKADHPGDTAHAFCIDRNEGISGIDI